MRRLFGRKSETFPVKRIRGSRAMYVTDEIQRVELKIELENGETIRVDMTPKQCHELVYSLTAAYDAIHPPITRYNPQAPQF